MRDDPATCETHDDPFAPERLRRLDYRLGRETWTTILDRLESIGWEAAVVGPPGTGKTTFLDGLARALQREGFRTWSGRFDASMPDRWGVRLPLATYDDLSDTIVLVDGCAGLGRFARYRLRQVARSAGGLVVADASRDARALRSLPVLHRTRPSPDVLADVVAELLPFGPRPDRCKIRRVFLRHGGNVAAALAALGHEHARRLRRDGATGWTDSRPLRVRYEP